MAVIVPKSLNPYDDASIVDLVLRNPTWQLELTSEGHVLASPLTGTRTGPHEGEAYLQLAAFARIAGGTAYAPSTGFRLPDNSLRGPDAAWLSETRRNALPVEATEPTFWRVCPDVVVEIKSEWDFWPDVVAKIDMYAANGAAYAIAIDCDARRVYERGFAPAGLSLALESIFDAA